MYIVSIHVNYNIYIIYNISECCVIEQNILPRSMFGQGLVREGAPESAFLME